MRRLLASSLWSKMFYIKLPRKFKMAIDNGFDSTPHTTFKDLGFNLTKYNTFDVYACGGLGPNPRMGIPVAHDVQPGGCIVLCESYAYGIC